MKSGVLYGVGVGPGDPKLLTLQAVELLQKADVIAIPHTGSASDVAWNVVKDYVADTPVLRCAAPMTRNQEKMDRAWEENADQICALLEAGKTVAFITLGDPSIYSTYWYLHRKVVARGYQAQMIPGVPSFCAAAAGLNQALCEGEEPLLIVPASHGGLEESLNVQANKVFMKAGRQLGALKEALKTHGALEQAALAVNCGLEGERYEPSFAEADPEAGYFAIVVVKEPPQNGVMGGNDR